MRFSAALYVLAGLISAADAAQTVGLYPPPAGSVADFIGRVHGFINPTDFRVSGPAPVGLQLFRPGGWNTWYADVGTL
jgi:hypothetical protein